MWIFATAVFLVLFFLLYRHPQATIKGILWAAVVLVVGGYSIYRYSTTVDSPSEKVKMSVVYGLGCGSDFPLAVWITNSSDKPVSRIIFAFQAFEPGHSTDLASSYDQSYDSDSIIAPGQTSKVCYAPPRILAAIT